MYDHDSQGNVPLIIHQWIFASQRNDKLLNIRDADEHQSDYTRNEECFELPRCDFLFLNRSIRFSVYIARE